MAVLTAGTSIKDDFLPGIDEPADVWADTISDAADEEYRRNVQEIQEHSRDLLSQNAMTKKEYNELIVKCRDRKFANDIDVLDDLRSRVVAEVIKEVRAEKRAERERAENK